MTTDPGGSPPPSEVARRRRRRVAAPLSRIVVAGLSASATFGIVAVMGAVANADGGTAELAPAADPAIGLVPPTTSSTILPTTTRRQVIVVEHLPAATLGERRDPLAGLYLARLWIHDAGVDLRSSDVHPGRRRHQGRSGASCR